MSIPRFLIRLFKPLVSRFPLVAEVYRIFRDQRELKQDPPETVLGFRFNGNKMMMKGEFEVVETPIIRELFVEVETVINVGANVGYYACQALAAGKHVVAFEPMPINLRYLLRNVHVNHWQDGFECFPMALSDKTGLIEIYGGGSGASLVRGWAGQENSNIVPVSTLDTVFGDRYVNEQCLFIVDIEGVELALLKGAAKHLGAKEKSLWFIEISVGEHQPAGIDINPNLFETFELMAGYQYVAYTADREPRLIELEEVQQIVTTGVDTLHTHNFLFVDRALSDVYLDILNRACAGFHSS